jgi:hypothetical protein
MPDGPGIPAVSGDNFLTIVSLGSPKTGEKIL